MIGTNDCPSKTWSALRLRLPAAWLAKRARDLRILDLIAHGASVKQIAAEEGLTTRRTRALVNEVLGSPSTTPAAPSGRARSTT
jgi:DNA-binding CsgD family transcriptional regulator